MPASNRSHTGPRRRAVGAALSMLLAACAPTMPAPDAGQATRYEPLDMIPLGDDGFERGAGAPATLLLPPGLARGPHHSVQLVEVDGFTNRYTVASTLGALEVESIGLLRKRVHEIEVLAALEQHAKDADVNLMPDLIECVKGEATLQEICDVLRGVFGEAEPVKL